MLAEHVITDHAAVRWLERLEGRDIDAVRMVIEMRGDDASDSAVLAFLAAHDRLDVWRLKRQMLTPAVRLGLMAGASGVQAGRALMVLHGGVVVTCYTIDAARKTRRQARQRGRRPEEWRADAAMRQWEMEDAEHG